MNKNELLEDYAKFSFQTLRGAAKENFHKDEVKKRISTDVAYIVGAHAFRSGITIDEIQKWLQTAYGSIWARETGLNPQLDLKEVFNCCKKAYLLAKKRSENAINIDNK